MDLHGCRLLRSGFWRDPENEAVINGTGCPPPPRPSLTSLPGDIITHINLERVYVVFVEFCGAIVFATIIASITSVVTSMDMNARKKVEQLDAVASFVEV